MENIGPTRKTQPRDISKRDRLIVVLLTVAAFILLFRPMISDFNVWRGGQYAHAGQFREAARAYRKAILLNANNGYAHDGLGFAYESRGQIRKAVSEYEKAVRLAPDTAYHHYILGITRFRLKNYRAALPHLQKAVRLEPNDFDHQRALASTYESLGRKEKALEVLAEIERRFEVGGDVKTRTKAKGARG